MAKTEYSPSIHFPNHFHLQFNNLGSFPWHIASRNLQPRANGFYPFRKMRVVRLHRVFSCSPLNNLIIHQL